MNRECQRCGEMLTLVGGRWVVAPDGAMACAPHDEPYRYHEPAPLDLPPSYDRVTVERWLDS